MTPQRGKGLLDYLRTVPDPRQRQGRRYPLAGLLAILILAASHGQSSLRSKSKDNDTGMWLWAQAHQRLLLYPLDFWATGRIPALTACGSCRGGWMWVRRCRW